MKYTEQEYISYDPFQGEMDVDIKMRKIKLVKTRKEHLCFGSFDGQDRHPISAGEIVRFESALIDSDYFGRYYWCTACLDKEIDKEKEYENEAA